MSAVRKFDPANDTHVAISEEAEYHLRRVAEAARGISEMLLSLDTERSSPDEDATAAIIETLAFAIEGALADKRTVFPGKGR